MDQEPSDKSSDDDRPDVEPRWFTPEENPFGILLLDVRPFTRTMVSYTKDPAIAESFHVQRDNVGSDLAAKAIPDAATRACSLSFGMPTPRENGPLFKAECMEDKWDIYQHDGKMIFARSWTGDVIMRASLDRESDTLVITDIESRGDYFQEAPQHVLFLVMSHLDGLDFPHMLSQQVPDDPADMALASFSMFGRRAAYATHDNILNMTINPNFGSPDAEASP